MVGRSPSRLYFSVFYVLSQEKNAQEKFIIKKWVGLGLARPPRCYAPAALARSSPPPVCLMLWEKSFSSDNLLDL